VCEKCISYVWAVFFEVSSVLFAMLIFRTNKRQIVRKTETKMSENHEMVQNPAIKPSIVSRNDVFWDLVS